MLKKQLFFLIFILGTLFLSNAIAQENGSMAMDEGESTLTLMEKNLLFYADMLMVIIIIIALMLVISIKNKFKKSAVGLIFTYLMVGLIFLGINVVITSLEDREILKFDMNTSHLLWHLLFYFGMISFIIGGIKAKRIMGKDEKHLFSQDIVYIIIFLILGVMVIIQTIYQSQLTLLLHHFVAFIFVGIAAFYFFFIKKNFGKLFSIISTPILIALIFLSLHHLWALLAENLRIVTSELTMRAVEKLIMFPSYVLMMVSFARAKKFLLENP